MARIKRAQYARLRNLSMARLKRAQDCEETRTVAAAPDTTTHLTFRKSEDYPRVGLDSCERGDDARASADITELTALEHFSSILQSAQRRAAEAEGSRGQRVPYTGKSERTIRRQKKALRALQAQGFHTLPDFFKQKAEEAKQKAKMEAMVAAATARLKYREEEEESSGTETVVDECHSKIVSGPDRTEGVTVLEPSTTSKWGEALGDNDGTGGKPPPKYSRLDWTELGCSK
ncbi:hypothetical protein BJY52DRAFT_1233258 [Lactarius psammicola]|nr:hypothetical protein BJY52DRAFT_1233258 [Lactarius psammicola]